MRGLHVTALFASALGGCAVVSGLGSLEVATTCDGGVCDSGVTADAMSDAAADGNAPTDAGPADVVSDVGKPEAASTGIACGGTTCTSPAVCCAGDAGAACSGGPCSSGTRTIACDDQTDCPAQVCCLMNGQTQCATSCGANGDIVCDPGASTPQCTLPKTCTETSSIQGVQLHNCN